jgi:IclR family acetate operon transcriptional repressor
VAPQVKNPTQNNKKIKPGKDYREKCGLAGLSLVPRAFRNFTWVKNTARMNFMDVKTAGRTVEIFELFAKTKSPMSLTDIARALNTPTSSCHALVGALEGRGYLYSVGTRRRLYPTRRLLEVAREVELGEPWLESIDPVLERLRDECRETVLLGKRQADQVVYLAVFEGNEQIRYTARAGDVKPLHASAAGKALLAALPARERRTIVGRLKLDRITQWTLSDAGTLLADLERSAQRKWAMTRGERVVDVMGIASTVALGGETCAIVIAGPISRMEPDTEKHVERLLTICRQIGGNL